MSDDGFEDGAATSEHRTYSWRELEATNQSCFVIVGNAPETGLQAEEKMLPGGELLRKRSLAADGSTLLYQFRDTRCAAVFRKAVDGNVRGRVPFEARFCHEEKAQHLFDECAELYQPHQQQQAHTGTAGRGSGGERKIRLERRPPTDAEELQQKERRMEEESNRRGRTRQSSRDDEEMEDVDRDRGTKRRVEMVHNLPSQQLPPEEKEDIPLFPPVGGGGRPFPSPSAAEENDEVKVVRQVSSSGGSTGRIRLMTAAAAAAAAAAAESAATTSTTPDGKGVQQMKGKREREEQEEDENDEGPPSRSKGGVVLRPNPKVAAAAAAGGGGGGGQGRVRLVGNGSSPSPSPSPSPVEIQMDERETPSGMTVRSLPPPRVQPEASPSGLTARSLPPPRVQPQAPAPPRVRPLLRSREERERERGRAEEGEVAGSEKGKDRGGGGESPRVLKRRRQEEREDRGEEFPEGRGQRKDEMMEFNFGVLREKEREIDRGARDGGMRGEFVRQKAPPLQPDHSVSNLTGMGDKHVIDIDSPPPTFVGAAGPIVIEDDSHDSRPLPFPFIQRTCLANTGKRPFGAEHLNTEQKRKEHRGLKESNEVFQMMKERFYRTQTEPRILWKPLTAEEQRERARDRKSRLGNWRDIQLFDMKRDQADRERRWGPVANELLKASVPIDALSICLPDPQFFDVFPELSHWKQALDPCTLRFKEIKQQRLAAATAAAAGSAGGGAQVPPISGQSPFSMSEQQRVVLRGDGGRPGDVSAASGPSGGHEQVFLQPQPGSRRASVHTSAASSQAAFFPPPRILGASQASSLNGSDVVVVDRSRAPPRGMHPVPHPPQRDRDSPSAGVHQERESQRETPEAEAAEEEGSQARPLAPMILPRPGGALQAPGIPGRVPPLLRSRDARLQDKERAAGDDGREEGELCGGDETEEGGEGEETPSNALPLRAAEKGREDREEGEEVIDLEAENFDCGEETFPERGGGGEEEGEATEGWDADGDRERDSASAREKEEEEKLQENPVGDGLKKDGGEQEAETESVPLQAYPSENGGEAGGTWGDDEAELVDYDL
uniref:Uncharacterized protein n=1 Tax=Chromera velia CCMP2878 TaxID=1169474 RepID=A0A0G4FAX3_9ALVE|eukprot:Cvel_16068.t1-p1 / transcript=Cvel_16068.t1 / gene=Cvel_16068 / organism=Chromera_velia_CCMP2878 / gene_product=hypothetical protein / transcript_product=hypothetical protein / location=Cvel_scaffold1221:29546-36757(+) / protein_length=1063 / sequence_SO=supercontig / SO=protein_coding / is_pseudo=false